MHERVLAEASVQKTLGLGIVGRETSERGGVLGAARRRRELGKSEEDGERGLAHLRLRVGEKRSRVDGEANAREQGTCRRLPNDSGEVVRPATRERRCPSPA